MKKLFFYAQIMLSKSYDGQTDKFNCIGIYNSLDKAKKGRHDFIIDIPADMVKDHLGTVIFNHIIKEGYCAMDEAKGMTDVLFPFQYHNILKGV